ncbi:MAG: TonB-dependent receptor [Candidatus Cyclobacteriaceae bacterium M3_2C_046]
MLKHLCIISICLALWGTLSQVCLGQKHTISGYIKDQENGESLIGANVFEKNDLVGTAANQYGFYSLTLPAGEVTLIYSYVGYLSQVINFKLEADTTINLELIPATLDEVVVTSERMEEIQNQTQMSTVNIPLNEIKKLPALLGETDVMKVIQLLPGVQSGNEGASGIYVRGGGPDQNLILLDGVPVYNASHLFGFFSVFNPDAINNVQLTKGGFPARYGGRLSSVLDITMKEGNNRKFQGEGAIGLISSKLTLEGPIIPGKTSFLVSGRRTYLDLLARPLIKSATDGDEVVGYYFYDLNAKINHQFSEKDRIYFSIYSGDDEAYSRYKDEYSWENTQTNYDESFGLKWGNIISALRWNHIWNHKLFSNTTLTYSRYRFNIYQEYDETITTGDQVQNTYFYSEYNSGIRDFAAKIDFDYLPNPAHNVKFGLTGIHHTFNPGVFGFEDINLADTVFGSEKITAQELGAYLEDEIRVNDRLNINAGFHLAAFNVENKWYTSIQPRFNLRYLVNASTSIKASYADMTQFVHLLTNSGIGLPTDLWLPSTADVAPQESSQVALGLARSLGSEFEVSLEGYYKWMENLIEYKEGATYFNLDQDWQNKIESGRGTSYGLEVFLQKKTGSLTGWLGYTLSWANRKFENLNFGRVFPYKYDRRHDISLALTKSISSKVDFSMAWVYGTGNAITLPTATYPRRIRDQYIFFGDDINHYESRNGFRMPAFHRLDLGIDFKKDKKWGQRVWSLGVYNLYNRRNPFFIDTGWDDQGNRKFIQYSLFPIIPSVRYSFKF